eukprot:3247327-Lingulodinium_polyedra.AAC.1
MYDDDGHITYCRTKTNDAVREHFQIPTGSSLLQHRRLNWIHAIGKNPQDNVVLLATLTGTFGKGAKPQITSKGKPTHHCNPWFRQMCRDLSKLAKTDDKVKEALMARGWYAIFHDPQVFRPRPELQTYRQPHSEPSLKAL